MSDALKAFAYLFLIVGLGAAALNFYEAAQVANGALHQITVERLARIEDDKTIPDMRKNELKAPEYAYLRAEDQAKSTKNLIGFASLLSGLISFLFFYSQADILNRTELLEKIYQNQQEQTT